MAGWILGALAGAGLSAWQSANQASEQKRAKRKYLEYLDKVKVNPLEEQRLLDSTGDVYMGQTVDAMNSSVGQGNLYNRDTQMALIKAKGLGARAAAQVEQKKGIFDFNKSIDLKKANAELQMPDTGIDPGAIAMGAIGGAQTAMDIESALAENKYLEDMGNYFNKPITDNTGIPSKWDYFKNSLIDNKTKDIYKSLLPDKNIGITDLTKRSALDNQSVMPITPTTKSKGKGTGYLSKTNFNLPGLGLTPPGGMGIDLTANQDISNTPSRGINQWWQGGTKRTPEMIMGQPESVNYVNNPYQVPNYSTAAETSTTAVNKFGQLKKGQQTGYLQNMGYQNVLNTPVEESINPRLLKSERGTTQAGYNIPGLDTPGESALDLAAFMPIGLFGGKLAKGVADKYIIGQGAKGVYSKQLRDMAKQEAKELAESTKNFIKSFESSGNREVLTRGPEGGWLDYMVKSTPKDKEFMKKFLDDVNFESSLIKELPRKIRDKGRYKSPKYSNFFDF